MPWFVARLTAAAALIVLQVPAVADQANAPSALDPTLQTFARWHAECLEWTNGCAVCRWLQRPPAPANRPWSRRGGIKIACSTPGVACQPDAIICSRTRPP